ncbi:hypothetical protein TEK04_15550 [Klenkia sp. LSe6-5]|uniref:Uncharacterized protein n=1 Tax=Klenkia sesuvii TaxID=3103137 RepID=A0ABU8DWB5_9ACTN
MSDRTEPQCSGSTPAGHVEAHAEAPGEPDDTPAAPVVRLLANPRRVRRT